jgi:hypothetical protein
MRGRLLVRELVSSSLIVLPLAINPELLISSLDMVLLLLRKEFREPLNDVLEPMALIEAREPWIEFREPCIEFLSACLCSCSPSGVGRVREGEPPGYLRIRLGDWVREILGVGEDGWSLFSGEVK